MAHDVISVSGLSIGSGTGRIVDEVSLSIGMGSITGLVGESGSGKTLTALSIMQLLPPGITASGSIAFNEGTTSAEILSLSGREMNRIRGNRISMIFQEPMSSLNPSLKCGYQAGEPLRIHARMNRKETREKVLDLFSEVGLPDPARIYRAWPHELSGGQRQRVMIAQALTTSPALLIADEPTTALDVTVQKKILELLLSLRDKYGLGILFISHDLSVIRQIADRVEVMYEGHIVESGMKEQVLEHPLSPYTRGLIACKPGLNERPERLPTIRDFMQETSGKGSLETRTRRAYRPFLRPPDAVPLVGIKNLNVTFGQRKKPAVRAVRDVSLEIFEGETLGLVGESGSGKTTLGRSILGLIENQGGEVSYRGQPLHRFSPKAFRKIRRSMQIVFQDPYSSLNPRMTAGAIISEPMRIHRLHAGQSSIRKETEKLLDHVGLPPASMDRYPHEFSGGQRQRIGIARALACQPGFIVLDESVSALDVSVQAQVLNLLNDLKMEFSLTYLFISHDLAVVQYMSDRIIVMKDGEVIEEAGPGQIFSRPAAAYTRELIRSIPG